MDDMRERNPLPEVCAKCQEVIEEGVDCACYNCEHALERFELIDDEEEENT